MPIPLFDLKAQHKTIEAELKIAFDRVLQSGQYILGPEVEAFESEVASHLNVNHAIGVSSGTDALLLALMASGIGPGDEVLCPAFTFFATTGCISRVGATPVFVDACPVCFNLDVADAARKVTERTRAIIPVHLFGQSAEMDGILTLAKKHDLLVIEDAAQSFGASYRDKSVGTMGHWGVYSFFPTKNLSGLGDSGMLVTQDAELADKARLFRVHGSRKRYFHESVGGNFRLDPLQAAFLRVKLKYFGTYIQKRRQNAAYYTEQLSSFPNISTGDEKNCFCLERDNPEDTSKERHIILPIAYSHNFHTWNQYTLRVIGNQQRDRLKNFLAEKNIGSEIYYPLTLNQQACFVDLSPHQKMLPYAEQLAKTCLSIPIYPELQQTDLDNVIAVIKTFLS